MEMQLQDECRARRLAAPALPLEGELDSVWRPRLFATAAGGAMTCPSTVQHVQAESIGRHLACSFEGWCERRTGIDRCSVFGLRPKA